MEARPLKLDFQDLKTEKVSLWWIHQLLKNYHYKTHDKPLRGPLFVEIQAQLSNNPEVVWWLIAF